ncbi:MAG: hypothetical protein LCH57_13745 [Proteobacteria bacterium]|uniref:hypothetical protein n=1 Tax=Brevundimonas sp. TaxID=1871086 RepID=UPI001AC41CF9|nr:hypothetical protein [Brevundimonas sp.]MBN9465003.1 hypothetical protein [Brevundimonas sp.]MCA0369099.1 hypothetical protein [Pseudomonadota bacterium]
MTKRTLTLPTGLVAVAALTLAVGACTRHETAEAEQKAEVAGDHAQAAASQAGEVLEAGAMKTAQAVESGAGKVADKLEEKQAKAAAEGRPGAVDPATDRRVPAN